MLVDLSYRVAAYEWYWSAMMCRVYVDFGLALSEAVLLVLFFFFQAEDGIRDKLVTGVQTYALPIYHGDIIGRSIGGVQLAAVRCDGDFPGTLTGRYRVQDGVGGRIDGRHGAAPTVGDVDAS